MKWATRRGRRKALNAAISAGDSVPVRTLLALQPDLINVAGDAPPPLHWAVYRNRRQTTRVVLDAGANIGLRDNDRGATLLDYAIVYARKEIVRILIGRGAETLGRLETAIKGAAGGLRGLSGIAHTGGVQTHRDAARGTRRGPGGSSDGDFGTVRAGWCREWQPAVFGMKS